MIRISNERVDLQIHALDQKHIRELKDMSDENFIQEMEETVKFKQVKMLRMLADEDFDSERDLSNRFNRSLA